MNPYASKRQFLFHYYKLGGSIIPWWRPLLGYERYLHFIAYLHWFLSADR